MFVREQTASLVHLVESFVDLEPQIGREFQGHSLGHKVPDLGLVAAKGGQRHVLALPAKRQDIGGCLLEVGRTAHLSHGDRHPRKIGVVNVTTGENV